MKEEHKTVDVSQSETHQSVEVMPLALAKKARQTPLSINKLCNMYGVSWFTFRWYMREHPELFIAFKDGGYPKYIVTNKTKLKELVANTKSRRGSKKKTKPTNKSILVSKKDIEPIVVSSPQLKAHATMRKNAIEHVMHLSELVAKNIAGKSVDPAVEINTISIAFDNGSVMVLDKVKVTKILLNKSHLIYESK